MDFIERIFQVKPDGGSGFFELAIILAVFLVSTVLFSVRLRAKRGADLTPEYSLRRAGHMAVGFVGRHRHAVRQ